MSQAMISLVGDKLQSSTGVVDTAVALKDKIVALYFSAHWCPPCRQFTPEFVRVFKEIEGSGKKFAVIFVSADQDQEAFSEYFGEQPWYAVPFENQETRDSLNEHFGIRGIPALLVLDQEGKLISREGRPEIMKQKAAAFDSWSEKAANSQ